MKLIIVESPTKAKTINKFLDKSYLVKSSYGHIRDLPEKEMGIDIEHDFSPQYVIPHKVADRVDELKKLAKKADDVILATDEDREGEAISWHLLIALELEKKFKDKKISRIVFHEITKSAIEKALANPREIDLNLVDAQQARRILDRLVGYELSPFLWKKIRKGLSAGRVQSMALRIIVEREKEIKKFEAENYWKINLTLTTESDKNKTAFPAELIKKNDEKIDAITTLKLFTGDYKIKKTILTKEEEALDIISNLKECVYKIEKLTKRKITKTPPPPFTTSTLQQSAISNLGYSSKQTMVLAQKLYEQGYITYMRTDSLNLSLESLMSAQKTIQELFGEDYSLKSPRYFKNKSKGAQEAHEAIRPAYPEKTPNELKAKLEPGQYKLYKLIWNRMIASQMSCAVFDSIKADISATDKMEKNIYALGANGSTLTFEGYLKVYADKKSVSTDTILPPLEVGKILELVSIDSEGKTTTQPPRYNEATLVKVLEENGIGRPSTYAPTISTIIERKYVDKNEEKRLFPLEIGTLVSDVLVAHFPQIVDMAFTATLEKDFDEIAEGSRKWIPVIKDFYEPFHANLKTKTKEVKKEEFQEKLDRNCPDCGGDLIVKFGRFGKFIACSNYPNCRYTEKTGEEKKLEQTFSEEICEKCGAKMVIKKGKFGTFLGCSNYPNCKNIKKIEKKIGIICPKCNIGELVERKSKRGTFFYACNTYPSCDFSLWNKPTGEKCPKCDSLLVFAAKGKIKCSKKECDFEN